MCSVCVCVLVPLKGLFDSSLTPSLIFQHLEAWDITFDVIQKKYDLAWPQSAGSLFG